MFQHSCTALIKRQQQQILRLNGAFNVSGRLVAAAAAVQKKRFSQHHADCCWQASIVPFLSRFLKLRYLIFGSALGSGLAARKKYNEIADSLPDLSWISRMGMPEANVSSISSTSSKHIQNNKKEDENDVESTHALRQQMAAMQAKYQKEIEQLQNENKEIKSRFSDLVKRRTCSHSVLKKSLIDMYSEVLDELAEYDFSYQIQDQLPRVVVVGDQSSGKTSVLEMITQARIFPRGAGQMMTRSPVQVTLSEGPYHVASFKDTPIEYDLKKASDRKALQDEIERRMKSSLVEGESVSKKVISLHVSGPGLQRMVLVDLPGIISTQTQDMAPHTKQMITQLVEEYLKNPNAIILCIQDGSVDAERSNVTDLVSRIDRDGERTIFVLTKIDCAERSMFSPERIKRILDGKLFPMKALGYFAVVAGKGNSVSDNSIEAISDYERQFFSESEFVRKGILKPSQVTTKNLGLADEIFDAASTDVLDQIIKLNELSAAQWEQMLNDRIWTEIKSQMLDEIYVLAHQSTNTGAFNTKIAVALRRMIQEYLPKKCIEVAKECLLKVLEPPPAQGKESDVVVDRSLKAAIYEEIRKRFEWDEKAFDCLSVLQTNAAEDNCVPDKTHWDNAIKFMEKTLCQAIKDIDNEVIKLTGSAAAGSWREWIKWGPGRTEEELKMWACVSELKLHFKSEPITPSLSTDQIGSIKNALKRHCGPKTDVDSDFIVNVWKSSVYRQLLYEQALEMCNNCRKFFFHYQKGFMIEGVDCNDVQFFWKVKRLTETSSNVLRLQIFTVEARRLERLIKDSLEELSRNEEFKRKNISGDRVELAERISKVRSILQHLEDFGNALSMEK